MKRRKRQIEKAKKNRKIVQRALAHRILELVMDRNETGRTTFFEFAGHTNGVEIRLYEGDWKSDPEADYNYMIAYLDDDVGSTLRELEAALCGK